VIERGQETGREKKEQDPAQDGGLLSAFGRYLQRECIADMLDNTLVFAHHSSLHRAILSLSWPFEPLAPI
jgi:hypothetical protein